MNFQRFLSLMLLLSLAACSFSPPPTPTPAAGTPTRANTATLSATLTRVPTATNTPRPTATPTQTSTPTLTPAPHGFYSNPGGFAFILPQDYELIVDGHSWVVFQNDRDRIEFDLFAIPLEDGEGSLKEYIENLITTQKTGYPDFRERSRGDATIGAGYQAQKISFSGENKNTRVEISAIIYYVTKNNKEYILLIMGPTRALEIRQLSLQKALDSVSLETQPIYGIERSKALVLVGHDPEADDLDPALGSGSAAGFVGHLFSGLVRLSPQLQVIPDLAETWAVSPDGTVYTFTLRTGLTFADGTNLTAKDVKYSWERAVDPDIRSSTAGSYLGDIVGVKEMLAGEAEEISGVQVIDAHTLVVTIDGPKPYFLAKLTYPTAYIVDQQAVEADPDKWMFNPNASGPFIIKEYQEAKVVIFQRNEAYHQPAGIPYVIYLLDQYSDIDLFRAGDLDITAIGTDDALLIMDDPEHDLYDNFVSATTMCTSFVKFNNQLAPMDDPLVRKAFALAIDREWFNQEFYEGGQLVADTILPPAMPGYSPDLSFPTFDSTAAMEALRASRYHGRMPKIVIQQMGYAGNPSPFMDALIDMWRRNLGVSVSIETIEPAMFMNASRHNPQQMVSYSWCADYPDPENFLDLLFHTESDLNVSGYSQAEVDTLLTQARTEQNAVRRVDLYHQAEKILLEDFSLVPMIHFISSTLVNSRIEGYVETPMGAPIIHLLRFVEP